MTLLPLPSESDESFCTDAFKLKYFPPYLAPLATIVCDTYSVQCSGDETRGISSMAHISPCYHGFHFVSERASCGALTFPDRGCVGRLNPEQELLPTARPLEANPGRNYLLTKRHLRAMLCYGGSRLETAGCNEIGRSHHGVLGNGLLELAPESQMGTRGVPPTAMAQHPNRVPKLCFRSNGRRMTWTTTSTSSLCHPMAGSCHGP